MFPDHTPSDSARQSKFRWMVAISLTAMGGFSVIASALWLMSDTGERRLATRHISPSLTVAASIKTPAASAIGKSSAAKSSAIKSSAIKSSGLNSNIRSVTTSKTDRLALPQLAQQERQPAASAAPALVPAPATAAKSLTTEITKNSKVEDGATAPLTAPRQANEVQRPSEPRIKSADASDAARTAEPEEIVISIEKGDTIFGVLTRSGIHKTEAYEISRRLTKVFAVSALRQGHALRMTMAAPGANGALRPERLVLDAGKTKQIELRLTESGGYELVRQRSKTTTARKGAKTNKAAKTEKAAKTTRSARVAPTKGYQRTRSRIQSSFYASAVSQNIPRRIVNKMSSVLSYGVDFQREISRGDVYEVFYANEGKDEGVLYSELNARGKRHAFYRFTSSRGDTGYFDVKGKSARKSLMATPVNGARITSGFGRRHHPILRYNKMHSGIDFGAPRGTPIYAAADGKIVKAGWAGGYGKYVRISHTKKMSTAYAHMSRISRGIRPGKRVRQGQIIGYVGSTGRSTGPHLHYEIRISGRAVNPLRYKGGSKVKKLSGRQLTAFKREMSRINGLRKKTAISTFVADASN